MTVQLTRAQLQAFLALIAAIVVTSALPVLVSAIRGRAIPDGLIAVSDKTVTGLVGVLGTLVGVMWQSRPKGLDPVGTSAAPVNAKEEEG